MLYSIEMRIQNSNIDIQIEYLDLEIQLGVGGCIEQILIDNRQPSEKESIIINDNWQEIQGEICWRLHEDKKYSKYQLWAGV